MIKQSAIKPDERFKYLIGASHESIGHEIISTIKNDPVAKLFGLGNLSMKPMKNAAVLLPPAKLQYGSKIVSPGLKCESAIIITICNSSSSSIIIIIIIIIYFII